MIRLALPADLDGIEAGYEEHFAYEAAHEAYTVWKKGVYPTRQTAADAIATGTLYVYEDHGEILASVIVDQNQPEKYQDISWKIAVAPSQVLVIHTLAVRPSKAGKGLGSAMVDYIDALAREKGCKVLRLDTGSQNIPAVNLYTKKGFTIVASSAMKVGGVVPHSGHLFLEKIVEG